MNLEGKTFRFSYFSFSFQSVSTADTVNMNIRPLVYFIELYYRTVSLLDALLT
jgi:hypothetical protein